MIETIQACSLSQIGKSAAQSGEVLDGNPTLQQFTQIVSDYSGNKLGIDFASVERLGTELAARLPDLKIYSYLSLAVFRNADGEPTRYIKLGALLLAFLDLLASPDTVQKLFPKNDSRRLGQLQWMSSELALFFEMSPPSPSEAAEFLACKQIAEQVAEQAGTAFGLQHPLLRELREILKKQAETLPPPVEKKAIPIEPKGVEKPAEPEPVKPVPIVREVVPQQVIVNPPELPPSPPPLQDVATLEIDEVEAHLADCVIRFSDHLRSESIENPAPYWMLRALRFGSHDLLRPERLAQAEANKGKTDLPVPQGHARIKKELTQRLAAGHYAEVAKECEELFAQHPLWLDLQRFSGEALAQMGASRALSAVLAQAALLVTLCPELPALRFSDRDATPLADSETVAWLEKAARQKSGAETGHAVGKEAEDAAETGLPDELLAAAKVLQKRIVQAGSGRQRFSIRLQLAEMLLAKQRSDIAMPVIEQLLADIETHRLSDWQPELAQKSLRLAVRVARAAEVDQQTRRALWNRICQIAPADAIELGPEIWPA